MKTLEELYNAVMSDRVKMGEFVAASGRNKLSAFAEKYGCNSTEEEVRKFFLKKCEGELSDDELEKVAGGYVDFGRLFEAVLGSKGAKL